MEPGLALPEQFSPVFSQRQSVIQLDLHDNHLGITGWMLDVVLNTGRFISRVIVHHDPHPPLAAGMVNFNLDLAGFDPPLQG